MKITPTMLRVLRRIEELDGCGVNTLGGEIFPDNKHRHMQLRVGQYMGRLHSKGLVRKYYDEYRGQHGRMIMCGVTYYLTALAREILKSEE